MKLKLFSISMLAGLMGLSSCNLDDDPDSNYQTWSYNDVVNLVIPNNGTPYATKSNYVLKLFDTLGEITVSNSNLNLEGSSENFTSSLMKYNLYALGTLENIVVKFSGGYCNGANMTLVTNLNGFTSWAYNSLGERDPQIGEYLWYPRPALVMQYNAYQKYTVKTFMQDAIYTGNTTIMTEGAPNNDFNSGSVRYRVYFQSDLKTADVIFYNAKFAERMPEITFVVKGLEVNYTRNGYTLSIPEGKTIQPEMFEGGSLTPYPAYTFTSFLLNNGSSDLTTASINYTITSQYATYRGVFNGYYVIESAPSKEED